MKSSSPPASRKEERLPIRNVSRTPNHGNDNETVDSSKSRPKWKKVAPGPREQRKSSENHMLIRLTIPSSKKNPKGPEGKKQKIDGVTKRGNIRRAGKDERGPLGRGEEGQLGGQPTKAPKS